MDPTFANWFALVSIRHSSELLAKRWETVQTLAKKTKRGELLNLVRVARNREADFAPIAEAARAHDETFQTHESDAELRVLTCAALAKIVEESEHHSDLVALALVTLDYCRTREGDALFQKIVEHAGRYLKSEGTRLRTFDGPVDGTNAKDFAPAIKTFTDAVGANAVTLKPTSAVLEEVTKIHSEGLNELHDEIQTLREESNMFWWAFATHSNDLALPFRKMGLPAATLVGAKELADLTRVLPGPRIAAALLDRLLAEIDPAVEALDLPAVVNAADRSWRSQLVKVYARTDLREIAPIHLAVLKSTDTESDTDWFSAYEKATGLKKETKAAPPTVALQAYHESLLVRAFQSVEQ